MQHTLFATNRLQSPHLTYLLVNAYVDSNNVTRIQIVSFRKDLQHKQPFADLLQK